jgi:hypothetical protein
VCLVEAVIGRFETAWQRPEMVKREIRARPRRCPDTNADAGRAGPEPREALGASVTVPPYAMVVAEE